MAYGTRRYASTAYAKSRIATPPSVPALGSAHGVVVILGAASGSLVDHDMAVDGSVLTVLASCRGAVGQADAAAGVVDTAVVAGALAEPASVVAGWVTVSAVSVAALGSTGTASSELRTGAVTGVLATPSSTTSEVAAPDVSCSGSVEVAP